MPGDRKSTALERLFDPPVTGLGDVDFVRSIPCGEARQLPGQRTAVGRIVECHVIHRDSAFAQCLSEVPHGAEQKDDLLRVMRNVSGFFSDLSEQHSVTRRIESIQGGELEAQLVAEHQAQCGDAHDKFS